MNYLPVLYLIIAFIAMVLAHKYNKPARALDNSESFMIGLLWLPILVIFVCVGVNYMAKKIAEKL